MGKETALTIIYKAEDQATDKAGKIFNNLGQEQEQYQRQAFAASHSAQETQLRDLDVMAEKAKDKYLRMAQAYADASAAAQKTITEKRAQTGGYATPEVMRHEAELSRIQGLAARNQAVMLDAERSYQAQRAQVIREAQEKATRDRLRQETMGEEESAAIKAEGLRKINALADAQEKQIAGSGERAHMSFLDRLVRGGRFVRYAMGGFIATAGLGVATGAEQAIYAQRMASDVANKPGASLEEIARARLAASQAIGNAAGSIPIAGDVWRTVHGTATNEGGLERLGSAAERSAAAVDHLGQMAASAAGRVTTGEAALYGYTAADQAGHAVAGGRVRRYGEMLTARDEMQKAIDARDLAAQQAGDERLGLGALLAIFGGRAHFQRYLRGRMQENRAMVDAAQRPVDIARARFATLQGFAGQEEAIEREEATRGLQMERARFDREAAARGTYQTPTEQLGMRHAAEMERFVGLDARAKAAGNQAAWQSHWVSRQMAALAAQGINTTQPWLQTQLLGQAPAAFAQEQTLVAEQQRQRDATLRAQSAEMGMMAGAAGREAAMIGLGASPLQSAARARALMEASAPGQAPEVLAARRAALREQEGREDEDRLRHHNQVMADAEAAASLNHEAIRRRDMERIAEGYAEDLRRFADNAQEKARINAEIAAKQRALNVQQAAQARGEDVSVGSHALQLAGRTGQAQKLELWERTRRLYERYKGDPRMLQLVNASAMAEEEQINYLQNRTSQFFQLHEQYGSGPATNPNDAVTRTTAAFDCLIAVLEPISAALRGGSIKPMDWGGANG
jgi:hypothetical protein